MDDLFSFFEQASAAVAPRVEPPRPPRQQKKPTLTDLLRDPASWQPERWDHAKKTPFLRAATARVRALAKALGLSGAAVVITVEPSQGDCPGRVLLRSAKLFIRLQARPQPIGTPKASALVRRVRALNDFVGVAGMDIVLLADELADVDGCAQRVTRALLLSFPLPERKKRS